MDERKPVTRRGFLKLAGLATAATPAFAAFRFQNLKQVGEFKRHPQESVTLKITKKVPQVCARACEANCFFNVVVGMDPKTGLERALTIEGRPEDPVSKGTYCIKALGYVDSLYDPDRLMVALKRTNPKKGTDYDPGWVTVKSNDAVTDIIRAMKAHKREEILICSPGNPATNKLCKSLGVIRSDQRTECFGTHYYINCLTLTNPPNAVYSSTYTPSHHVPAFDFDMCRYQVWFGYDSMTKLGKAALLNHFAEVKRAGGKIVMFNPMRTPYADTYAHEYHAIKPGTDLAVALAMINLMLAGKTYNAEFLKSYSDAPVLVNLKTKMALKTKDGAFLAWDAKTSKAMPVDDCAEPVMAGGPYKVMVEGGEVEAKPVLELLRESTNNYSPEWAAKISEVPAAAIRRITADFAAAAPYAMIPSNKRDAAGPNYANSWRLRHAISVINTLAGSIDHEGGILMQHDVKIPWFEDLGGPNKPYPELPPNPADFRSEFPVTNNIYRYKDFSAPGHYGMLGWGLYKTQRAKVIFFVNPHRGMFATIQPQMVEKGLENKDLVVDWNLYLDDIGYWCDYVLPASHQFEDSKLDVRSYFPKQACLVGGAPVQKPQGDVIGWGSIAFRMGLEMAPEYWTTDGSSDPHKAFPMNTGDAAVRSVGAANNTKEFMANGAFWIDNKQYENYKHIRQFGYGRPNGRVRMFIDEFTQVGHDALPSWHQRWQTPEGEYRYSMLVTRAPWYMQADPNFLNNPVLKQLTVKNHMDCVWVNKKHGEKLGLKEGDEVVLQGNPKYLKDLPRPVKAKVHLSTRIVREDCVLLYHGIGHRAKNLRYAKNFGYRDGDLVPQKDPMMSKKLDPLGMGWVEDVFVSLRKA